MCGRCDYADATPLQLALRMSELELTADELAEVDALLDRLEARRAAPQTGLGPATTPT